jgi:hypothetical protein
MEKRTSCREIVPYQSSIKDANYFAVRVKLMAGAPITQATISGYPCDYRHRFDQETS